MALLSVQLDLAAAAREAARLGEPDPSQVAVLAELAGADGVSVTMRQDRRYLSTRDLYLLKGIVKTKLMVEIPPVDEIVTVTAELKPWMVMLVADRTGDGGRSGAVDFGTAPVDFSDLTARFDGVGVSVGFFIEPDQDQIKGAAKAGASAVLINCRQYTEARTVEEAQAALDGIDRALQSASKSGLATYCGCGITYKNVGPLAELGAVDEFVIGRAICGRAMLVGVERAVREMVELVRQPQRQP